MASPLAQRRPRVGVVHPYWTLWEHTAGPTFRADRMVLARGIADELEADGTIDAVAVVEIASGEDGAVVGRRFSTEGVDVILVLQTMAVPAAWTMAAIDALPGIPVVVWALHETGLVEGGFDHGRSRPRGRPWARRCCPTCCRGLIARSTSSSAGGRRGYGGSRPGGPSTRRHRARHRVEPARADRAAARGLRPRRRGRRRAARATGIQLVAIDPDEVVARYREVAEADVGALEADVRRDWTFEGDPSANSVERSLRAALALEVGRRRTRPRRRGVQLPRPAVPLRRADRDRAVLGARAPHECRTAVHVHRRHRDRGRAANHQAAGWRGDLITRSRRSITRRTRSSSPTPGSTTSPGWRRLAAPPPAQRLVLRQGPALRRVRRAGATARARNARRIHAPSTRTRRLPLRRRSRRADDPDLPGDRHRQRGVPLRGRPGGGGLGPVGRRRGQPPQLGDARGPVGRRRDGRAAPRHRSGGRVTDARRPVAPGSLRDLRDQDPYPAYERMRAVGPVVWDDGMHAWLVLSHDGCTFVERREDLFAEPTGTLPGRHGSSGGVTSARSSAADTRRSPGGLTRLATGPHRSLAAAAVRAARRRAPGRPRGTRRPRAVRGLRPSPAHRGHRASARVARRGLGDAGPGEDLDGGRAGLASLVRRGSRRARGGDRRDPRARAAAPRDRPGSTRPAGG